MSGYDNGWYYNTYVWIEIMLVIWWYLSGAHGLLTHTVTHVAEPGHPANPGRRAEPLPDSFMPGVLYKNCHLDFMFMTLLKIPLV